MTAATPIDISSIGMRTPKGEPVLDSFAQCLRERFSVDAALVSIIDKANGRQVFKGICAPNEPWSTARETPLSQSLCVLVAENDQPLVLDDVAEQIPDEVSTAFRDLGVRSYLGVPLHDDTDAAVGALCLITTRRTRIWSREDVVDLSLFAQTVETLIAQRLVEAQLDRAMAKASSLSAARKDVSATFDAMINNLPGVTLRYALFDDGTDAMEEMSGDCFSIWGYEWDEISDNTAKLWDTVLEEERLGVLRSLLTSAARQEAWCYQWNIRNRMGERRLLRGYGTPHRLEGDVGTLWDVVVLDLTRIDADSRHLTQVA